MPKKVLIITYYWPPAGGPGVQRWLKFVKYLGDFEVEPIVCIPENPTYPLEDATLGKEVQKGLQLIKSPINEPYKKAKLVSKSSTETVSKGIIHQPKNQSLVEKLLLFIRGNFFIPDARKGWIQPTTTLLKETIQKEGIDTIITTGPPHSVHLIGLGLKEALGVRWVADFRDPWTTIGYHKKLKLLPFAKRKHKQLESQVLNTADEILVTSFTTQNEFEAITQQPIAVITNGYDEEEVPEQKRTRKFSIMHIGSLLTDRNPKVLWEVLQEMTEEDSIFKSQLELTFVGAISDEVLSSLEAHELSQFANLKGYVSHKSALKYQRKAQVLLLVEINSEETKCIIPGKLFEYIAAKRPILALGPEESDVQHIIRETKAGHYFTYAEKDALKMAIQGYFEDYGKQRLEVNSVGLAKYSRKALTEQLSKIIRNEA
ncbi:MAG: glycosyltransferase family 4 protein [bacterium]